MRRQNGCSWPNEGGWSPVQVPYNKALLSDKFLLRSKFSAERGVMRYN